MRVRVYLYACVALVVVRPGAHQSESSSERLICATPIGDRLSSPLHELAAAEHAVQASLPSKCYRHCVCRIMAHAGVRVAHIAHRAYIGGPGPGLPEWRGAASPFASAIRCATLMNPFISPGPGPSLYENR